MQPSQTYFWQPLSQIPTTPKKQLKLICPGMQAGRQPLLTQSIFDPVTHSLKISLRSRSDSFEMM
jgi:hypothetical protein